jgi:hypothetical protein
MPVCNLSNINHRGIELHQEHAMSPLSAITRLGAAAAALALAGCYYPYGYYPYGANGYYPTTGSSQTSVAVNANGEPVGALNQHNPIPAPPPPSVTASGSYVVPSPAATATSQQIYTPAPDVGPAYSSYPYAAYPYAAPAYPYYGYGYGYGYPYWGPSVSVGFAGFWGGGCCWGGGWHGGGWHGGGWHGGGGGHWH